jgi:hypothetical protein
MRQDLLAVVRSADGDRHRRWGRILEEGRLAAVSVSFFVPTASGANSPVFTVRPEYRHARLSRKSGETGEFELILIPHPMTPIVPDILMMPNFMAE